MQEKEEIKEIFNNLTEENKDILSIVAKGMEIAQKENKKE